jgi:pimeloyl-ACP methyl ester carboxylesterase
VPLDQSRTLWSLYWQQLGRGATETDTAEGLERLATQGLNDVVRFLSETPEGIWRTQAMREALSFEAGRWHLPYHFEPASDPTPEPCLVVRVHGVTMAASPPPHLGVHTPGACRLAIGSGPRPPYAAESLLTWSESACQLVRHICDEHGVSPRDVLFVGHSWAGTLGAMLACRLGSGTAVVGAPAVLLGTVYDRLKRLAVRRGAMAPLFEAMYKASEIDGSEERREALDHVLTDLLATCHEVSWVIGASKTDSFWHDSERMVLALPINANVQLQVLDYARHDDLEEFFNDFAAEQADVWLRERTSRIGTA